MTDKKIGCVNHDCDACAALKAANGAIQALIVQRDALAANNRELLDQRFELMNQVPTLMTREQMLDVIKVLSALEAWSFANQHRLPDYLIEDLNKAVKLLSDGVLK